MSESYAIHEPNTLFALPQPIDQTSGETRAGRVFGIHGSRKRQRSEVVVGVDGECLSLFNIKTAQLLATYALPPQTYLTASPASARVKLTKPDVVRRFTYAATRNQLAGNRHELLCFQDDSNNASTQSPTRHVRDLTSQSDRVVHLETIPSLSSAESSSHASHQVIVIHRDGDISLYSADLQTQLGRGKIESQTQDPLKHHVELAAVQTSSHARTTLLAGRPDLAVHLDEEAAIVFLVTSSGVSSESQINPKTCHIISIRSAQFGVASQVMIETLVSWPLTSSETARHSSALGSEIAYNNDSATLYERHGDIVVEWNFKHSSPTISSEFRIGVAKRCQLLPLSRSAVLVCSQSRCVLYNTHYGTPQATQTVGSNDSASVSRRKRKRLENGFDHDNNSNIIPVAFYQNLNIAVCLVGCDIIAFGLSMNSGKAAGLSRDRLIDSLGRSQGLSIGASSTNMRRSFENFEAAMTSEDAKEFDNMFLEYVQNLAPQDTRALALWLLGKIFHWNPKEALDLQSSAAKIASIKVVKPARQALNWSIDKGLLTPQNIAKALLTLHGTNEYLNTAVSDSDMVLALARADPSLSLLTHLLTSLKLGISGYVESFRVLMESFDPRQPLKETHFLEDAATSKELVNGVTEHQLQLEETAALEELELAANLLEGEHDARGTALKVCIERLGTNFSSNDLVHGLRHHLSHQEIFMLVDILRIELDQAGWTSRRLDFHPSFDKTENQNEAITVICKLLNCALDAIGTAGWLSRNESNGNIDDDIGSTISLLRADTTAVLEGVQESTFFSSFLKDFIRFEEALKHSRRRDRYSNWSANDPHVLSKSMLPLGLKEAHRVAHTRIKAGGEIHRRSARERGLEMSQKVGKYTFETIRI